MKWSFWNVIDECSKFASSMMNWNRYFSSFFQNIFWLIILVIVSSLCFNFNMCRFFWECTVILLFLMISSPCWVDLMILDVSFQWKVCCLLRKMFFTQMLTSCFNNFQLGIFLLLLKLLNIKYNLTCDIWLKMFWILVWGVESGTLWSKCSS